MSYCEFINKVQSYQGKIETKDQDDYVIFDPNTFNINTYLNFFDKLYIKAGYRIDALYYGNSMGGQPFLCGLKDDQNFDKVHEHIANNKRIRKTRTKSVDDSRKKDDTIAIDPKYIDNFLKKTDIRHLVIPEDSEYGFLQYLFWVKMSNQFALYWHSLYLQKNIICSLEKMDRLIEYYNSIRSTSLIYSITGIEKFNQSSVISVVTKEPNCYQIIWYEYRNNDGIYRCRYMINRKPPFDIKLVNNRSVLKLNSNICY